jgi:hypothetical protein
LGLLHDAGTYNRLVGYLVAMPVPPLQALDVSSNKPGGPRLAQRKQQKFRECVILLFCADSPALAVLELSVNQLS